MEHHLLWWYVAVVRQIRVKSKKDCFRLSSFLSKNSWFSLGVSFVESNNVLSLSFILVALNIANKYKFGILRLINSSPLSFENRFTFLHDLNIYFRVEQIKSIDKCVILFFLNVRLLLILWRFSSLIQF